MFSSSVQKRLRRRKQVTNDNIGGNGGSGSSRTANNLRTAAWSSSASSSSSSSLSPFKKCLLYFWYCVPLVLILCIIGMVVPTNTFSSSSSTTSTSRVSNAANAANSNGSTTIAALPSTASNNNNKDIMFLSNEDQFTQTLRDCTDMNKCGHHKVNIDSNDSNSNNNDNNNDNDNDIRKEMIKSQTKTQRIAILSPPNPIIDHITSIIQRALVIYYDNDISSLNRDVQLIRSTHVPPYGYGKSHGYTKIIRVVSGSTGGTTDSTTGSGNRMPLLLGVIDAWEELTMMKKKTTTTTMKTVVDDKNNNKGRVRLGLSHINASSNANDKTIASMWENKNLLKQSLRQVVRWHCRLSHVAAHTMMYNMNISMNINTNVDTNINANKNTNDNDNDDKDVNANDNSNANSNTENPILQELITIIELILDDPEKETVEAEEDKEYHKNQMATVYDFLQSSNIDQFISSHTTNSLELLQSLVNLDIDTDAGADVETDTNDVDTMAMLSEVLSNELQITNNLKKWPCLSFWDVNINNKNKDNHKKGHHPQTQTQTPIMDDISIQMANALSPRCSDPFTRCGVKKDHCEEKGDAQCT